MAKYTASVDGYTFTTVQGTGFQDNISTDLRRASVSTAWIAEEVQAGLSVTTPDGRTLEFAGLKTNGDQQPVKVSHVLLPPDSSNPMGVMQTLSPPLEVSFQTSGANKGAITQESAKQLIELADKKTVKVESSTLWWTNSKSHTLKPEGATFNGDSLQALVTKKDDTGTLAMPTATGLSREQREANDRSLNILAHGESTRKDWSKEEHILAVVDTNGKLVAAYAYKEDGDNIVLTKSAHFGSDGQLSSTRDLNPPITLHRKDGALDPAELNQNLKGDLGEERLRGLRQQHEKESAPQPREQSNNGPVRYAEEALKEGGLLNGIMKETATLAKTDINKLTGDLKLTGGSISVAT